MIFRLTAALATRLKLSALTVLPPGRPALDWSAHCFRAGRSQFALLLNTRALYTTLMPLRGVTNSNRFVAAALEALEQSLHRDGLTAAHQSSILPAADPIQFSKPLNASVTASLNGLIDRARYWLTHESLPLPGTSSRLNDIPLKSLKYASPREVFTHIIVG